MKLMLLLLGAALLSGQAAPPPVPSAPPGKIERVNGIDIHYRERGRGEPLLLLHGFGACGADWDEFADALATRYRVITPDLRGHGWSTNPSGRFTMRQSAADVRALLDRLGLDRVKAMGISGGGMTLLHLAAADPGRLQSMVLIGATTHYPDQARRILNDIRWDGMPPFLRTMYLQCAARGEPQARFLLAQFGALDDVEGDMAFDAAALRKIAVPTLIVHGDRDEFFPVEIPIGLYRGLPNAELWIVPGGDHVPIYEGRKPEFLRVTGDFLQRDHKR